jgi:hypothetical protein
MASARPDPERSTLYRLGGISAIVLGLGYVVITVLFVMAGPLPPQEGEAWLDYLDGQTADWWAITGLSVLTDVLFLPIALALYAALSGVNRVAMLAGSGLLAMFVILDLAITWPNFAVLIDLSSDWAAAGSDAERATYVAAATYAAKAVRSALFAVYAIGVPSLGILLIGLVMRGGAFGNVTAWLGIVTGVLGVAAVIAPAFWSPLTNLAILTSVLTLVWVVLAGIGLLRLGRS